MELNLPVMDRLVACENLLIAGMGGGFDIFCGLPIYFELRRRGRRPHLANLSFVDVESLRRGDRLSPTLVGVGAEPRQIYPYFPEYHLARWLREETGEEIPVWCLHKAGAQTLWEDYRLLVDRLSIDGILLVDGGVDSLVRGDEAAKGTFVEDAVSLYAVDRLTDVPTRLLACVAFGAEEDLAHAHVLENVAALTRSGDFLGACALLPQMESYQAFERAVLAVHAQPLHDASVINASLISAVRGHYGDYHLTEKTRGSRLWISPLMTLYWCFGLEAVARRNLFLPRLEHTRTFRDAMLSVVEFLGDRPTRPPFRIPL